MRIARICLSLVLVALMTARTSANFRYADFNETTGLWFVQDAATTSCFYDAERNYGDTHGDADPTVSLDGAQTNDTQEAELGETTDSVFVSSVETHQQIYNEEIDESQAGFLHRKGTISAPSVCAVRSRLTPSGPGKVGAMWFRDEVPVSNGFDTYFTFQISDHSKECTLHKDQYFTQQSFRTCSVHGGDGFAFVLHYAPESVLTNGFPIGGNGGQMGFGGIKNSLAVAFDTWQNPGEDTLGVDHISIQSKGEEANDALEDGLLGLPRYQEIADGAVHMARIKYFPELVPKYFDQLVASDSLLPYLLDNGEQKRVGTLVVFIDDGIDNDVPIIALPINLSLLVKMPSDKAYVGFTSSTGRFYEKHDIMSWVWCDQEPCDEPETSDFDWNKEDRIFGRAKEQFYQPGTGYGGGTTDEGFPSKNQNPNTDPWSSPQSHFAEGRTEGLASDATSQVPPATDF